ncbi:histidine-rich glycoprotein [Phaenicophaeus curvirostris]|uniref:histidine-rich glycoprotein n=1 Tax=Phaenicophaeus curvirostris TaxID=33595 RepID=UPI0037F098AC
MLLLASVFFLILLQCSSAQDKTAITPADCNNIEKDAGAALDLVNRHRRDGYIFGLFRVADAHKLHTGNSSVLYLTLDVLETECPVLSRRHWESCDYADTYSMDFGQCKIITYTSQLLKKPQLYGFNCTLSPVPPDLLECKDCPVKVEVLEVTEQHKNIAAKALLKFNSEGNHTNYFNVDKVEKVLKMTASREGHILGFSIKETNCSKSAEQADQALECDFLDDWHAHVGFCKARIISDPDEPDGTDISCEIYRPWHGCRKRCRYSTLEQPHRHPHHHCGYKHRHRHHPKHHPKHGCPFSSQFKSEDPEHNHGINEEYPDSHEEPVPPPPHHNGPHHPHHPPHHCPPPPPHCGGHHHHPPPSHDGPHPPPQQEPQHPPSAAPPPHHGGPHHHFHPPHDCPPPPSHRGPHHHPSPPPPLPHEPPHDHPLPHDESNQPPSSQEETQHPSSAPPPHEGPYNPPPGPHHGPHCPPPHGPHHHHPPPHHGPHCPPPPPHGPHHHHPPPHHGPHCPPPPPHGPHHHHPPPHHGPHCPPPPPHGPHHHHPPPHHGPHCPPPHGPHCHHPHHHHGPHHPPPPGHPPYHCNKTSIPGKYFPFQVIGAVYHIPVLNQQESLTPPTLNFPELSQSSPHSSSTGKGIPIPGSSLEEVPETLDFPDIPTQSKSCPGNPKLVLPKILPLFPHSSTAENSPT